MILGYFTAWPVNRRLVSNGIKEKMDHRRHLGMMLRQTADERSGEDDPTQRGREGATRTGPLRSSR
jgi:hypothetical protein